MEADNTTYPPAPQQELKSAIPPPPFLVDLFRCLLEYRHSYLPDPAKQKIEWHKAMAVKMGFLQVVLCCYDSATVITLGVGSAWPFMLLAMAQMIGALWSLITSSASQLNIIILYMGFVLLRTLVYLFAVFLYGGVAIGDFSAMDYDIMRATIALSEVVFGVMILFFAWEFYSKAAASDCNLGMERAEMVDLVEETI